MFSFEEIDESTRQYMLSEFRLEQEASQPPFRPKNLTSAGLQAFVLIMQSAIQGGTEESLEHDLSLPRLWIKEETQLRRGKLVSVAVPADVRAKRFAITDFNTWYVRGLCAKLIAEGVEDCEVYRAQAAYVPRGECLRLEGQILRVRDVFAGHRAKYHPAKNPTSFSVPVGPNCHHSIRRVKE